MTISDIMWVEKYRPDVFEKIVLDDTNRTIFQNIQAFVRSQMK